MSPKNSRRLTNHLNDDPVQAAVLAGVRQMLADQIFAPWVTARWDNTVITGRVHRDETFNPYLFAEGVWHLHSESSLFRPPHHLAAAVPAWDHAPKPMDYAALATVINNLLEQTDPPRYRAVFVNRETCMAVDDAEVRVTPTRVEICAAHRRIPIWTKRDGTAPKLIRMHPTTATGDRRS